MSEKITNSINGSEILKKLLLFAGKRKIVLGLSGLILVALTQVPFISEHFIISVNYCEDKQVEESCEVLTNDLLENLELLLQGSLDD